MEMGGPRPRGATVVVTVNHPRLYFLLLLITGTTRGGADQSPSETASPVKSVRLPCPLAPATSPASKMASSLQEQHRPPPPHRADLPTYLPT